MSPTPGDLALLDDPVAQNLLSSTKVAHLAYTWSDGTPRVVPIWFHWNGATFVMASPSRAPKAHAISNGTHVALSIDGDVWPYKVLLVRGIAEVSLVDGMVDEYAIAAERYFGEEQGKGWTATAAQLAPQMFRIEIKPMWVRILDFEQRFPQALADAMSGA
jgi:nitroimidazol reductase NimA-like FMN-containing flavoprotein (pyridoxamine 5'-phosphate oxidase superfamily)